MQRRGDVLMEHNGNRTPKNLQWLPAVFACCLGLLLYLSLLALAEAAVEPVIPCLPETDMIINYDSLVDCSIDFNGDSDLFRFAGQDGETVLIQVSELAGTGDACIDLFRPDGSLRLLRARRTESIPLWTRPVPTQSSSRKTTITRLCNTGFPYKASTPFSHRSTNPIQQFPR